MRDAGVCLSGLVVQIAQYPVSFRQDTKLTKCIAAAVYISETDKPGGVVALKPMAV